MNQHYILKDGKLSLIDLYDEVFEDGGREFWSPDDFANPLLEFERLESNHPMFRLWIADTNRMRFTDTLVATTFPFAITCGDFATIFARDLGELLTVIQRLQPLMVISRSARYPLFK